MKKWLEYKKRNLQRNRVTILTNNCLAGLIYRDYDMEFCSPTINLFIEPDDFIKFVVNLRTYLEMDLEEVMPNEVNEKFIKRLLSDNDVYFPIGKCGDILIYFLHYDSFEQAKEAWKRRGARVNFEKIFVVLYLDERNYSIGIEKEFERITYPKKILTNINGIKSNVCRGGVIYLNRMTRGEDWNKKENYQKLNFYRWYRHIY